VKELKNHHHAGQHRGHPDRGHDSGHHAEEAKFAVELGAEISRAVGAHEVRDVVLVAPSKFLSELTGALPKSAAAHVTGKVQKDFAAYERHDLARRVKAALADSHDTH
jgi:protein required for attachment to host cells